MYVSWLPLGRLLMYVWTLPLNEPVVPLFLLMHYCIFSINDIIVPTYFPYPLALHCISMSLPMKFDNDRSTKGDGKRRDHMKWNCPSVGFIRLSTWEERFLAGWTYPWAYWLAKDGLNCTKKLPQCRVLRGFGSTNFLEIGLSSCWTIIP